MRSKLCCLFTEVKAVLNELQKAHDELVKTATGQHFVLLDEKDDFRMKSIE